MKKYYLDLDKKVYKFSETDYDKLMQRRINQICVICSNYDAFLIQQDGRIDEQIFTEYTALNLRYPPHFIFAFSAKEAKRILKHDDIDLVINMLSIDDEDPILLSESIKQQHPDIPVVVLTQFSREIVQLLKNKEIPFIDYVFFWMGEIEILLVIIKLLEDEMNAEYDINKVGVQAILLIEDSVRFYSLYLPVLYKLVFKQSRVFLREGLNVHHRMMKLRSRPKILLAKNTEEAEKVLENYGHSLLGVISDVSFPHQGEIVYDAGFRLIKKMRAIDPFIPILMQSSDNSHSYAAYEMRLGFIHKNSKTLKKELRNYVTTYFAFGDFIFRDPIMEEELLRVKNLKSLQHEIKSIPDHSLLYHANNNHLSKWMNARGLFTIAEMFKSLDQTRFKSIGQIKDFMHDAISAYRKSRSLGVISIFDKARYDHDVSFARIGRSYIGGKARGIAFLGYVMKNNDFNPKYKDIEIKAPKTLVISTDIFDEFMDSNNMYEHIVQNLSDEQILEHFLNAGLPASLSEDLKLYMSTHNNPIAIRSSSLLEDSHYQPFAGVYSTFMIPNNKEEQDITLENLLQAIKSVYASVFFQESISYMQSTTSSIEEEKMGVVLQEVVGKQYGNFYYPHFSGVARSSNFYPLGNEKPEDGIVNIGLGLGSYIVEGGKSLRYSPLHPKHVLQLSSPEMAMQQSQTYFHALNLDSSKFNTKQKENCNIEQLKVKNIPLDNSLQSILSHYDVQDHKLKYSYDRKGIPVPTFWSMVEHDRFSFNKAMYELLKLGKEKFNKAVEIEFAGILPGKSNKIPVLYVLQIRPIPETNQLQDVQIQNWKKEEIIVQSNHTLGNGIYHNIRHFVYVKPENFDSSLNLSLVDEINTINNMMREKKASYVLIGPGRWGSSDHWLGIPVKWANISEAAVIIETASKGYDIEPSQGTHFFQNLTSFHVSYFTINLYNENGTIDFDFLRQANPVYDSEHLRIVEFKDETTIYVDGKRKKGLIYKPNMDKFAL